MNSLTIKDLRDEDIRGKRALVRVDFNVPIDDDGNILDDLRISSSLETIRLLIGAGARLVLMSHLDRPKGKWCERLTLERVSRRLAGMLGQDVVFIEYPLDGSMVDRIRARSGETVLLIDNLRFHPGEKTNDDAFASMLAGLGDFFVNDAFGTAHRAHASTVGVTRHIRPCVAGCLMEREIEALEQALSTPKRPFVAILGGSKVKGKIKVIRNLLGKVDTLLIGGAMANTFFAAMGYPTGASLFDEDGVGLAHSLLREAEVSGATLILPQDCVVAKEMKSGAPTRNVGVNEIPPDWMALDIGPLTRETFRDAILRAKTVVWNGPMGAFEYKPFDRGTVQIAEIVAEATGEGTYSVIGGGESVAAIRQAGLQENISHVSTGGGACIEFLAGNTLPGIHALNGREEKPWGGE